jgi:hypothetical protein
VLALETREVEWSDDHPLNRRDQQRTEIRKLFGSRVSSMDIVSVVEGDATWHDGPGWYYTYDEYPDEGSCGAFATQVDAVTHAALTGCVIRSVAEQQPQDQRSTADQQGCPEDPHRGA